MMRRLWSSYGSTWGKSDSFLYIGLGGVGITVSLSCKTHYGFLNQYSLLFVINSIKIRFFKKKNCTGGVTEPDKVNETKNAGSKECKTCETEISKKKWGVYSTKRIGKVAKRGFIVPRG